MTWRRSSAARSSGRAQAGRHLVRRAGDRHAQGPSVPEHDHGQDGQEELYVALRGGGEIEIEGERHPIDPETFVRVGPGVKRKVWPSEKGLRLLAIGGVPGQAYEVRDFTELGARTPFSN